MNRHLLVATDGSTNAHHSLRYVANLCQGIPNIEITVMTVAEPLPSFLIQGGTSFQEEKKRLKRLDDIELQRTRECAAILDRAESLLKRNGIPAECIHKKSVIRSQSTVRDILFEARHGLYDALVIGRRGLGRLASFYMGSVSYGVVQQLKDLAVWIVDEPIGSGRVLIAVDACEHCLHVADYASFALSGMKEVKVTLFHVIPKFRPLLSKEVTGPMDDIESMMTAYSEERITTMFSEAHNMFKEAGFKPGSVEVKIKHGSTGVARDIVSEYEKGGYGTLVMGRRGIGGWEAIFPGSVSTKVLHTVKKGAIWLVA